MPHPEKLQIVFFHIPKTGGTTFKEVLMKNNPNSTYHHLTGHKEKVPHQIVLDKLKSHDLVFGHFRFIPELANHPLYLLTFLRNPEDRVISNFLHYKRENRIAEEPVMTQFERFLSNGEMERNGSLNFQTQYMLGDVKNSEFNANQNMYFNQALEHLKALNFVGITEHFRDSTFLLCKIFGWNKWYYMPQNVSNNSQLVMKLKSNFKNRIAELNELDQELYNKGLELYESQKQIHKIPFTKKYKSITLGYIKQLVRR
jgi:hypothetical protein